MLKDVFCFVEHQEKATYGLGYKLIRILNKDDAVLHNVRGIVDARIKIDLFHWYVPHYTPCIEQQGILSQQILSKSPTEFSYIERSVLMKEVNNHILCYFEFASQERMNVPLWRNIGFQQRDRQDSQNLNKDGSCTLPVTSSQCISG